MFPSRLLLVDWIWRSTADQQALFAIGRTTPPIGQRYEVTMCNGVTSKSNHQNVDPNGNPCSLAVDLFVEIDGKYMGDGSYYEPLVALALKYNLKSGLDWSRTGKVVWHDPHGYRPDADHLEFFGSVDYSYLNAPIIATNQVPPDTGPSA